VCITGIGAVLITAHTSAHVLMVLQGFEKDELDPFKMSFAAAGNHRHITAENAVRYVV
jgi:hypothetical protein